MANCGKDILLSREGTEQQQRFIDALDPSSVKLNDFGIRDWMEFAYNFASCVNYFDVGNDRVPAGNWQDFFRSEGEIDTFLKEVAGGGNVTPHLALFVSFVQLLSFSKKRFNRLTKRHLDFYYRRILKIEKLPATPDKVHAIFELAKNVVSEKIAGGTQLDGGKDATGKKLIYKTTGELVANQTRVASLKSVYNDEDFRKLKAAATANSYDGKGEDFPGNDIKWWPFGYYEKPPADKKNDRREYPELEDASVGFALSGEILELQEGDRIVQVTVTFTEALKQAIAFDTLNRQLKIVCTGEKGWLDPATVIKEVKQGDTVLYYSGTDSAKKELHIAFRIPRDEEAVVKYDPKIHLENFDTKYPVCRFLIDTGDETGHALYHNLVQKNIKNITVDVDVKGVRSLILSNDIGTVNAEKPFYPFGTQPVKKSKFNIGYPELFKKKWKDLSVEIKWKNTPANFKDWYLAYRSSFVSVISASSFIGEILPRDLLANTAEEYFREKAPAPDDVRMDIAASAQSYTFTNLIVNNDSHFTAAVEIKNRENWVGVSGADSEVMFEADSETGGFKMAFDVDWENTFEEDKNGPIRLSLNKTFLHEMYPRLYAIAMSSDNPNALIPNEPYTPFVEEIGLDYRASAQLQVTGSKDDRKEVDLFHEHPFGQSRESLALKANVDFFDDAAKTGLTLVPAYCYGGELYIGLENAEKQQTVSLLVQMLEGSENPETDSFRGKQKVEWWILCNNHWKELDSTLMIANDTDNLLKSGIVRFIIPKEATDDNTLLPKDHIWVRARMHKKFDAVSKAIGIHAQAVEATFSDNGNDLAHLEKGLAAKTISKMINRIPKVKGVEQPYNSFGGSPEESGEAYYRRVSERLRHKNRAITIWDYEHLVLQNFPEIHKVKCLSHTSTETKAGKKETGYLSPGSVMLVVIPDIVNKNVFDIYQPRVSKATLNRIQEFLRKLNSLMVNLEVINPEYEEVTVSLKVKFYKGYDEVFYKTVLEQDLTKLLSPYAFDTSAAISFGLSLHKSVIIDYIEKLDYVDFVTDVKLYQKTASDQEKQEVEAAVPSRPEAILVSARSHDVDDADNPCLNTTTEPAEKCRT